MNTMGGVELKPFILLSGQTSYQTVWILTVQHKNPVIYSMKSLFGWVLWALANGSAAGVMFPSEMDRDLCPVSPALLIRLQGSNRKSGSEALHPSGLSLKRHWCGTTLLSIPKDES